MFFALPRGGRSFSLPRILKSNLNIRPCLPVSGSGLYIKTSSLSSHAVLSRLPTPGSTNMNNFGVARRPGSVESVTNMHRRRMQGVRLGSTLEEAGTKKEGVKQVLEKKEAIKAEEVDEEVDEDVDEEMDENFEEETEENYKARFPAIHDVTVTRKTDKGDGFEADFLKAYVFLEGRKQGWRKPRVWVSFSGDKLPEEVASMQWPTGKEGATKVTLDDWEEGKHDLRFRWPMPPEGGMEFQVVEKTLVKGNRRIWREVIQKGEGELVDGGKGKGE
ncbi:hypothetical protein BDR22DRAFT_855214 [Usnea florida]